MASAEIERMVVRLLGDATNYEQSLKRSAKATQSFAQRAVSQLKRVSQGMKSMGRSLSLRVTAPLTMMGGASVLAFSRFDLAMTESLSIMKTVGDESQRMRDLVIDMSFSGDFLQAPKELAEAYFFLASAGKNASQSMALIEPVALFATAGAFDMAKATDLLTDAQSALGMTSKATAKDMKNLVLIGNTLVKANTLANASVQQFATSLTTKAGSSFKVNNIALNEGIALLAAYADQGIKAELAGNATDRMLRLLTKAVAANGAAFKAMKVDVFDANGEFLTFDRIIGSLEKAVGHLSTEERAAALSLMGFEARVQAVITPLLGTSDALRKYAKELIDVEGVMDEVAQKQMKAFGNQMKILKNRITVVAIEIGMLLEPAITRLGKSISNLLDNWRNLNESTKKTIVFIAVLAAIVGPLLISLGSMVGIVGLLAQGITFLLGPALVGITTKFIAMGVSAQMGWALATVGLSLLLPTIILLVMGITKLVKESGVFESTWTLIKNAFKDLKPEVLAVWYLMSQMADKTVPQLVATLKDLGSYAIPLVNASIIQLNRQLKTGLQLLQGIVAIIGSISDKVFSVIGYDVGVTGQQKATNKSDKKKEEESAITAEIEKLELEVAKAIEVLDLEQDAVDSVTKAQLDAQSSGESWVKSLELQGQTFGLSARKARIFQMELQGVSRETLAAARAVDEFLTSKERQQEIDSTVKSSMSQIGDEILKLSRGYDDLDMMLHNFRENSGASIADVQKFIEMIEQLRGLREADKLAKEQKKEQDKQVQPRALQMRQAAQVGTAEAQSRIMAFRSGAGPSGAAERTANHTERIVELLETVVENPPGSDTISAADFINIFRNPSWL